MYDHDYNEDYIGTGLKIKFTYPEIMRANPWMNVVTNAMFSMYTCRHHTAALSPWLDGLSDRSQGGSRSSFENNTACPAAERPLWSFEDPCSTDAITSELRCADTTFYR